MFAPDRLFKVVLVGNSSVGKTSLLRSFCEGHFHPSTTATVGEKKDIVIVSNCVCVCVFFSGRRTQRISDHMKGLVKSHRLSGSPGTHCAADYVTFDEFFSTLSSFPILRRTSLLCPPPPTLSSAVRPSWKNASLDPLVAVFMPFKKQQI